MKNYRDSDYAGNKYAKGIVYRFANQTVEVTLEDYLKENPSQTEAEFAELKAISDELYFHQDRHDNAQSKKTVSFHALEETRLCAVPSPEDSVIAKQDKRKKRLQRIARANGALDKLTEIQRRRYILYVVNGLTMRRIAEIEGVCHSKIQKSLMEAEKKVSKFLASS